MQAMDTSSWEPALSYLLPGNPPLELLERARDHVLTYLDWVATDLASRGDADAIRKEINRAATRLIQISLLLPFALTATIDERSAKERVERDQQRREQEIRLISDQHEPKPNQLRPVLTMKVMDTSSWEPALSYLLPENPSLELLERARDHVLTYLDWVASDLSSSGDADAIRKEINRAAIRLIQISLLLPFAFGRHH
jgi:hypothetical protein